VTVEKKELRRNGGEMQKYRSVTYYLSSDNHKNHNLQQFKGHNSTAKIKNFKFKLNLYFVDHDIVSKFQCSVEQYFIYHRNGGEMQKYRFLLGTGTKKWHIY
jgi:hypothetical protein